MTVIAATAEVEPPAPVAVRVTCEVAVGTSVIEPEVATAAPLRVAEVAFVVVHVRVTL